MPYSGQFCKNSSLKLECDEYAKNNTQLAFSEN